jgi:hypothetical protein
MRRTWVLRPQSHVSSPHLLFLGETRSLRVSADAALYGRRAFRYHKPYCKAGNCYDQVENVVSHVQWDAETGQLAHRKSRNSDQAINQAESLKESSSVSLPGRCRGKKSDASEKVHDVVASVDMQAEQHVILSLHEPHHGSQ